MTRLSVIISVRDGADVLAQCLQSLEGERPAFHEIVVIDDGSVDRSAAVARAAGCLVHRLPRTVGIPRARNAGAERASGDVLAFLDADTVVRPGWASSLRDAFADGGHLVGGGILQPAPRSLSGWYRVGGKGEHDEEARNGFLPFAAGANFAIRAEVFAALQGFDEVLPGAEDVDLSFRAQLAGYGVTFVPEAAVVHPPRGTVEAMLRQHLRNSRNRRVADAKYAAFPFQRMHRRDPLRVLRASFIRRAMVSERLGRREFAMPLLNSAMAATRRAAARRADLEMLTGLQPQPCRIEPRDHEQRRISAPLLQAPRFLLVGEDRFVALILRHALDAGPQLSLPPEGLETEALSHWDAPAPWSLRLARSAHARGWAMPPRLAALRIEREQPRTWGEAFLTVNGVRAWLHECRTFAIAAPSRAGAALAARLPGVPVVVAGAGGGFDGRALMRVTRRDLIRHRQSTLRELEQALDLRPGNVAAAR